MNYHQQLPNNVLFWSISTLFFPKFKKYMNHMLGRVQILECFGKNRSSPSSKLQLREYLLVVHLSRRDSETWKQTVLQVLLFLLFLRMIKVVITAELQPTLSLNHKLPFLIFLSESNIRWCISFVLRSLLKKRGNKTFSNNPVLNILSLSISFLMCQNGHAKSFLCYKSSTLVAGGLTFLSYLYGTTVHVCVYADAIV